MEVEEFMIQAVDMSLAAEKIDEEAKKDSTWLWEEPGLVSQVPITDEELAIARQEEVQNLNEFGVLEYADKEEFNRGNGDLWNSSRWEDLRKDAGRVCCRWVLREFATSADQGDVFSPTPDHAEVELMHVHGLDQKLDVCSLDVQRAFLHAPEVDRAFTSPPEGCECGGQIVRLKRKVYGRRNGPQVFMEWLAIQLCQRGRTRSRLCPCTFSRARQHGTTANITAHVDDLAIAALPGETENILDELREVMLLKVTG